MNKKLLVLFALILTINTAQQSKSNLNQTINWITGKLEGSYNVPNSNSRFQKVSYDFKRNVLLINKDSNNDPTYEIPFKDINPFNIEIEIAENELRGGLCANINIFIVGRKSMITARFSDSTKNYKMNGFPIIIPDNTLRSEPDLPERLKKAFKSAIESLTGKKEVF